MDDRRLELHEILCEILNITESDGDRHVYFQPPSNVLMKYDAIKYSLADIENVHADNQAYNQHDAYEVIVICRRPDSDIPRKVSKLPMCSFDRFYPADNLNHYVFTLYF